MASNAQGMRPGTAWKLGIITLAHVVGTVNIVSVLAMAPVIQRDLDLSVTQFGLLVTAYNGAQAAGALPAGGLVDRLGVGWVLALALVILAAATAMLGQATDFTFALGSVAVMGLGYSLVNPATARGVLEWFPPERRATAMGVKQTGVPLGGILAAGNGALAAFVSWQSILGMVSGATAIEVAASLPPVEGLALETAAKSAFTDALGLSVILGAGLSFIGVLLLAKFMPAGAVAGHGGHGAGDPVEETKSSDSPDSAGVAVAGD